MRVTSHNKTATMRILHTADWHLGKRLDNFNRHEEQVRVLEEIIEIANEQSVDVIIIAGDLYDSINPPLDSQALFFKTLKRLTKDGKRPVIAIAGNHDSPDRIDSPDPLAKECGIIFIGKPKADVGLIEINDSFKIDISAPGFFQLLLPEHPPLRIFHTAFANEQRWQQYLGTDKAQALNEALKDHWHNLAEQYANERGINLLVTHMYMMQYGGEELSEPEGEKPLKLGNASIVYTNSIPAQIQYTALGHLHQYHNIGTVNQPIVYSGSPLAYSFSESNQKKFVIIVEAQPNMPVTYEKVTLNNGKTLFKKTFDSIDECADWLTNHPDCLVELTIKTDTFLTPQDTKRLKDIHDGIVFIIPVITNSEVKNMEPKQEIDLTKDVMSLFVDYFKYKHNGVAPNDAMLDILKEIIAED